MAFDPSLVAEIKSRADIVDIISSYINVIKKGRNYFAVCPFHDDHNPSLSISKDKNMFKCFVCGTSGDVFSFVSRYENITYSEAIKRVAEMIGYDDPRLHQNEFKVKVDESKATLYKCITDLATFYQYGLSTEEGQVAHQYLSERGLTDEQIAKFSLGYAFKDGSLSIDYLKRKEYSYKNIEDIGISLVKTSGMKDSNAGRVIFPIKDNNGQFVGFSARKLDNANKDDPKYVNTAETKIFSKGNILYNFDLAKNTMKHDGYLYVVEGFMDVFALDSIGVHSVVGLMGTAMTKTNVQTLKRANVEIRLCLDNDKAGQIAMMNIISMFDEAKINYRLVSDPNEICKDSDEILHKEGPERLNAYINTLVNPFNFALAYYTKTAPLATQADRYKVINHFTPLLVSIQNGLELNDYIYKLARVTGFEVNTIKDHVALAKKEKQKAESKQENFVYSEFTNTSKELKTKMSRDMKYLKNAEKQLLGQMLINKEAVEFYESNVKYFSDELYRNIANFILDYAKSHQGIDAADLVTTISLSDMENKQELIDEIVAITMKDNPVETKTVLTDYANEIKLRRDKIYQKDLLKQAFEGKSDEEKARLLDDYIKRTNK